MRSMLVFDVKCFPMELHAVSILSSAVTSNRRAKAFFPPAAATEGSTSSSSQHWVCRTKASRNLSSSRSDPSKNVLDRHARISFCSKSKIERICCFIVFPACKRRNFLEAVLEKLVHTQAAFWNHQKPPTRNQLSPRCFYLPYHQFCDAPSSRPKYRSNIPQRVWPSPAVCRRRPRFSKYPLLHVKLTGTAKKVTQGSKGPGIFARRRASRLAGAC